MDATCAAGTLKALCVLCALYDTLSTVQRAVPACKLVPSGGKEGAAAPLLGPQGPTLASGTPHLERNGCNVTPQASMAWQCQRCC